MPDQLTTLEVSLYDQNDLPIDSVVTTPDGKRRVLVGSHLQEGGATGEVTVNPTQYTILERLKKIATILDDTGITIGENRWQDNALKGRNFVVASNNVTISGLQESDFMILDNPVDSGVIVRLYKANFGNEAGTTSPSTWRIYRDCVHSALGTPLTISNLKKGAGASAVMAYKIPTITNRGTFMAGDAFTSIGMDLVFDLGHIIMPDEHILLTFDASTGNVIHHAVFYWSEEPII